MGKLFIFGVFVRLPIPQGWQRLACACLLVLMPGLSSVALAESVSPPSSTPLDFSVDSHSVSAKIEALDSFESEQERLKKLIADKPKAYQDKVMEGDDPAAGTSVDDTAEEVPEGFRSWAVEGRVGFADTQSSYQGKRSATETGVRLEHRFETRDYGEFSVQADLRHRSSDQDASVGPLGWARENTSARVTVRNYDLPVTTSIMADTSVGDISSEVTDAFQRSYRLSLGNSPVRGAGVRLSGEDFDVRAGAGKRGEMAGGPYPGFEERKGSLAWAGVSKQFNDEKLTAGVQVSSARGVSAYQHDKGSGKSVDEDVNSVAVSLKYGEELANDGDRKARVTLINSAVSSADHDDNSHGIFLEGGFKEGRYRHELGLYGADPDLRFGDNTLVSNSQGAYWRADREGSRLTVGGGVDVEKQRVAPAGGDTSTRIGVTANARYRLDRDDAVGGNASVRNLQGAHGDSVSSNLHAYYQTRFGDLGNSRFSATLHRNESLVSNGVAATGDEIQWEQDWISGKYETMRPELSTILGLVHDRSTGNTETYPTAGISGRYWLDSDLSVAGSLRHTSRSGNLATSQGLSGTASTEYNMGDGWRTGASASINQARVKVSGNSFIEPQVSRSDDKLAQMYIRWDEASGEPYQLVGTRNVGSLGNGSITGAVYFDGNRDGEQQADEANVPGVEVFLDERYRTTTGKDGRFEFVQVTTGKHELTLNLDSIPLPWGVSGKQAVEVDVPLRGWVEAYLPVVKTGE